MTDSPQASYVPPLPHPRGVKDRIQAIDNLNLVFGQLKNENLRPVNISEVDIADGNVKLTLGLLWYVSARVFFSRSRSCDHARRALSSPSVMGSPHALVIGS